MSVVVAVARACPFLTVSPGLTFTSVTGHVTVLVGATASAVARYGSDPNTRPYVVADASAPVAATSFVTSPTVAGAVRYSLAVAGLAPTTPTLTASAPTPSATRTTSASSLRRMFAYASDTGADDPPQG